MGTTMSSTRSMSEYPYRFLHVIQLQPGNTLHILGSLWRVLRASVKGTKRSEMQSRVFLVNYYDSAKTTTMTAPAFDRVPVLKE